MKKEQIDFIRSLDQNGTDGTIQSVLLRGDLAHCKFEATLCFLVQGLKADKDTLYKENMLMRKACLDAGIDLNSVLQLK